MVFGRPGRAGEMLPFLLYKPPERPGPVAPARARTPGRYKPAPRARTSRRAGHTVRAHTAGHTPAQQSPAGPAAAARAAAADGACCGRRPPRVLRSADRSGKPSD